MFCVLLCLGSQGARADIVLTDAAGREVRLAAPAKRIVINDSLLLLSLALLDPEPARLIAGWADPRRIEKGVYEAFLKKFPDLEKIPVAGAVSPADASPESVLSVRPDLFVVTQYQQGWESAAALLNDAGVPVIYLDGPSNAARSPAEATAFTIELLGAAIGRAERAVEYGDFVKQRYRMIENRLRTVSDRPKVLLDAFAGSECCSTGGRFNRLTQNIRLAGGVAIGSDTISGYQGRLNPEAVLAADPDVYIGTGTPHVGGLSLGGGIDTDAARASLATILSQGVRADLKAVRERRAFGVSHQIAISTLNVVAFECFAKWIHPELFADIDPDKTLAEINQRFLAAPLQGTFWIDLANNAAGAKP